MANDVFSQAVELSRAGRKDEARPLFIQILELNPYNESAWLWYIDSLSLVEDRKIALEECLQMLPDSQAARRGLDALLNKQSGVVHTSKSAQPGNVFLTPSQNPSPFSNEPLVSQNQNFGTQVFPFTISPEDLTEADLETAEREFTQNKPPDTDSWNQEFGSLSTLNERKVEGPTQPQVVQPETKGKKQSTGWQPVFSDEEPAPPRKGWDESSGQSAVIGGSRTQNQRPPETSVPVVLKTDSSTPEQASAPAQTVEREETKKNDTAPKVKKESHAQSLVFYLTIGIVIVLILLIVVLVLIVSPK